MSFAPPPPAPAPRGAEDRVLAAFRALPAPKPAPGPEAAVAVVFSFDAGSHPALLLIRRATRTDDPWSGQVALPGGRRDATDPDIVATAIRETREEVGLRLERRHTVATLDAIQARHRGAFVDLWVVPVVFVVAERSAPTASEEVDEARWIPIPELAADDNATEILVATADGERHFPAVALGAWVLWGLTHRILAQLLPIGGFRLAGRGGRDQ